MTCEYLIIKEGTPTCKVHGRLEESNSEKISECYSNFAYCLEKSRQFIREEERARKGIGDLFVQLPSNRV